jgi:hypothetical protein
VGADISPRMYLVACDLARTVWFESAAQVSVYVMCVTCVCMCCFVYLCACVLCVMVDARAQLAHSASEGGAIWLVEAAVDDVAVDQCIRTDVPVVLRLFGACARTVRLVTLRVDVIEQARRWCWQ